jgi:hypothetical protein
LTLANQRALTYMMPASISSTTTAKRMTQEEIMPRISGNKEKMWIIPILLLLFASFGAPTTRADSMYTYMFTYELSNGSTFSFTTEALDPTTALGNPENASTTTAETFSGYFSGTSFVSYELDGSNSIVPLANLLTDVTGGPIGGPPEVYFSPSDYSAAGMYAGTCEYNCETSATTDSLIVTATPEPSTGGLVMLGIGLMGLMGMGLSKKRLG